MMSYCAKLTGEDLSRHLKTIESEVLKIRLVLTEGAAKRLLCLAGQNSCRA